MFETALLCLALNIFHEGRGESTIGQEAIAQVTMNRAEMRVDKVCSVVFEPYQFSWTNNLKGNEERFMPYREPKAWEEAKRIAYNALKGEYRERYKGVTHYHRLDVSPYWRKRIKLVTVIDNHLFYKDKTWRSKTIVNEN